jgi:hypothetical protein
VPGRALSASAGVALIVANPNQVGLLLRPVRPNLIEFGFKRREEPPGHLAKKPVGDKMTHETLIL